MSSTTPGFDIDPDNRDSIFAWGLVRPSPWHFVGLFRTAAEAHEAREEFGDGYIVRHGLPKEFAPSTAAIRLAVFSPTAGMVRRRVMLSLKSVLASMCASMVLRSDLH